MPEHFLRLSEEDQGEILAAIAGSRSAIILEKDILGLLGFGVSVLHAECKTDGI